MIPPRAKQLQVQGESIVLSRERDAGRCERSGRTIARSRWQFPATGCSCFALCSVVLQFLGQLPAVCGIKMQERVRQLENRAYDRGLKDAGWQGSDRGVTRAIMALPNVAVG
jgi:hypothetical protein